MKEVAVIIPTLNEERFIAKCLDSLILQSYPFEEMDIMVIDGRSNDRTREIVDEYHKKFKNIRLIDNPGKIQSIAFNIGVKESTTQYVVRLDAHALYDRRYIELCVAGLKENLHRGNIGGLCEIIPQNNSLMAETNAILNYSKFGIGGAAFRVGGEAHDIDTVPFGAFPRRVIDEVGGMREDLPRGEDNEYNSRIRKAGYLIYFNPNIKCQYFARATFKASAKQMLANGESIGILYHIDRRAIGLRHIIPVMFVVGLITGPILSVLYTPFFIILLAALIAYFICELIASLSVGVKHGWKYLFPIFILFPLVHISYGIGTIKGLLKKKY